jgi:predicted nucleotidyltransferase
MDADRVDTVARRYGILLLLQFGSSVTGRMHAGSDVDLGVLLEHMPDSFDAEADVIADLQALLPGREADVAFLNRADPLFLKQITDHCELLYGSPRRLEALKLYAFKRYQDHQRYLEMERVYVDRKIAALTR